MRQKPKNEKTQITVERKKRKTRDEGRETRVFIYLLRPGCERFSSASLHPSARSLCRPGGLCFSQAPVFSAIRPANPACPAPPKGPCAAPPQAPSVFLNRIEPQRSGFDSERRSPAAQSKNRQAPKAIAGSEPCAGCSDEPQKV